MVRRKILNRREFMMVAGVAATAHCMSSKVQAEALGARHATVPGVWGYGQLLAFSGIDGPTDYSLGLVARTLDDPAAVEIVFPAQLTIPFGKLKKGRIQLTCDTFQLTTENGVIRGAFPDAHHLLVEGAKAIDPVPEGLQVAAMGSITLIGSKNTLTPGCWIWASSLPPGKAGSKGKSFRAALAKTGCERSARPSPS
jgi:hypothetical protein